MTWAFGDLPKYHFRAIVADPNWNHTTWSDKGRGRSADRHYKVSPLEWIASLPVRTLADPRGSHLFLWVPNAFLAAGLHLEVMRKWHYQPSSIFWTWVKTRRGYVGELFNESHLHIGLGKTSRRNAEFVVLGRRGAPRRRARDIIDVGIDPVREHSRKPDKFLPIVERYCRGPYVELFSRTNRPDWSAWGDELGKFKLESV